MTTLRFNGEIRKESAQSVIENLTRKGWEIIVPPEPPQYDQGTHKLIFNESTNQYSLVELTNGEKAAYQQMVRQNAFSAAISSGYEVSPEGWVLGLQDSDRGAFTQMVTLIQEGVSLGLLTNDSLVSIRDVSGDQKQLTVGRFRQIMVGYGFYFKTLWDEFS